MAIGPLTLAAADFQEPPETSPELSRLWDGEVGLGFARGTHTFTVSVGGTYGIRALGSKEAHHLALASASYGRMLGSVFGENRWWRGNFELRGELFGGAQFSPSAEWIVGLSPHVRYNFAIGSRWVPFIDGGAGVTATSIGPPDLSNIFEFNLQGGAGTHRFVTDRLAVTVEARFIHLSCAGLSKPNRGLNGVIGLVGLTWLF